MKKFLIRHFALLPDEDDRFDYEGWMMSQSLGKRSLAVFGHWLLGFLISVIIALVFIGLAGLVYCYIYFFGYLIILLIKFFIKFPEVLFFCITSAIVFFIYKRLSRRK